MIILVFYGHYEHCRAVNVQYATTTLIGCGVVPPRYMFPHASMLLYYAFLTLKSYGCTF